MKTFKVFRDMFEFLSINVISMCGKEDNERYHFTVQYTSFIMLVSNF